MPENGVMGTGRLASLFTWQLIGAETCMGIGRRKLLRAADSLAHLILYTEFHMLVIQIL